MLAWISLTALTAIALISMAAAEGSPRTCTRLGSRWRFHRGDVPGAQEPGFDDASWREVSVPHDWSIEDLPESEDTGDADRNGPFVANSVGGGAVGYTVGGVGWYRLDLGIPQQWRGKQVRILFDGVYMDSEVWLNGVSLGRHPYGYTSFHFDLTPHLNWNGPNVLALRMDSSGKTSRWYAGSGIYRHVWLISTAQVHIVQWGIAISTPQADANSADVNVIVTVCNESDAEATVSVNLRVLDPGGSLVAECDTQTGLMSGERTEVSRDLKVAHPHLWSPDSPALYKLITTLSVDGEVTDRVETPFGIRTFTLDAENGFILNGQPMKLRGGCVHHDNGPLGACTYDRAEDRRVELLKAAGFNALRTAHNPPSPRFLDACDRIGMLVMDEAFDCWQVEKNPEDYHRFYDDWWRADMDAMILRDRNHPCVFAWSIGNEVVEQSSGVDEGPRIAEMMAAHVRTTDPTRPVAIGAHPGTDPWEKLDPLFAHLDLCGYNYKWEKYAPDHERVPSRVIAGTESFPKQCFESWIATIDNSWVIGDFVWTSFDYLGEVALGHTHYEGDENLYAKWPWTAANCGDIDICGFRRPQSYYREIAFGAPGKVACFVATPVPEGRTEVVFGWGWHNEWPSWTWPGHEGETMTVRVYSSCPKVRLLLNGNDLGTRETNRDTRFEAVYEAPYEPGELVAVGLDASGAEVARWALETASKPASIRLSPDRTILDADGQDLSFIEVEVLDDRGILCANAANLLTFTIAGPGSIVAVANSNPQSIESFQQPRRKAWRGRALVVVKAGDEPGKITLTASAEGISAAEVSIAVR